MTTKNEKANGKAKRAATGCGQAIDSTSTGGQSSIEPQSEGIGLQRPQCNDSGFSTWRSRGECDNKPVDANLGEVLEHLGNLETRFYSYVHAHQERLDIRRKESSEAEQEFQQEAKELREKILSLLGENEISSQLETPETEENS
jgi:hypothetical protein